MTSPPPMIPLKATPQATTKAAGGATPKTWFITGTSRGFGRAWTTAALQRGDRVAATAREMSLLKDLVDQYGEAILPIALDVTDREADFAAVARAHAHFGQLDVVVNNAGYGHFGFTEELTESEARAQLETNLFGALWVTQAALPLLRAQGSGHIVQVSSIGGVVAFPGLGIYHASKWALEGLTEALASEVAGFGIHTTLVEPAGFATDWSGSSASHSAPLAPYQFFRDARDQMRQGLVMPTAEDSVQAVLAAVDAEQPPSRLLLSSSALDVVLPTVEKRLVEWRSWQDITRSADPS